MADKVINFAEKRSQQVEKKRRSFERVLFENFLGSYSVLDDGGSLYPIQLIDISDEGCQFQVPWNVNNKKTFDTGMEVSFRMYFTQTSFIPVNITIKRGHEFIDDDGATYMRYGCEFDKSLSSFKALESFIDFLYKFAEHSSEDKGDSRKVYFL